MNAVRATLSASALLGCLCLLPGCGGGGGNAPAPAAPGNVRAAAGDGAVTLTWDPVAGAAGYSVYLAAATGVTPANYASLQGGGRRTGCTSPAVVTGLANGTTYYFRVTATAGGMEGAGSAEVSATPAATGFTSPATGAASGVASSAATLAGTFQNPAGTTTSAWFEYGPTAAYGAATPAQAFLAAGVIPVRANLSGLSPRTTYHYRLVTDNPGGRFPGEDATFTTLAAPRVLATGLDAPTGLVADGTFLYWYEVYSGRVRRLDSTAQAVQDLAALTPLGNTAALALGPPWLYVSDTAQIHRMGLDGSAPAVFCPLAETDLLVADATGLYARAGNQIVRIALADAAQTVLYTRVPLQSEGFGGGLAVVGADLYWTDYFGGTLMRLPLAGGAPVTVALGLDRPLDLVAASGYIYVAVEGGIHRVAIADGTGALLTALPGGCRLALGGGALYAARWDGSGLCAVDPATGVVTPLTDGFIPAGAPAATGGQVAWLTRGSRYEAAYGTLQGMVP